MSIPLSAHPEATPDNLHELRRTGEYYSCMVDNLVDGLIVINTSGLIESANPATETIFGYAQDEMVGQNINMLMPEPDHSMHDEYIRRYLATGDAKVIAIGREVLGRKKDGSLIPVDLAVSEVWVDGERRFMGTLKDIAHRKFLESEIANREIRQKKLYEAYFALTISHDIYGENLKSTVKRFTAECTKALNLTRASIWQLNNQDTQLVCLGIHDQVNGKYSWGQNVLARDYPAYFHALRTQKEIALTNNPDNPGSTALLAKGFDKRVIRLDIPFRFNDSTVGVLCLEDVDQSRQWRTDTKQFAHAIANLLSLALQEAERKRILLRLDAKNQQLVRASNLKSEFLANMSHELRTPLNAIIGFSEILRDGGLGELTDEQKQYISLVFDNGQHLLGLLNEVLDLSKIDAGMMTLYLDNVDIPELLESSLNVIRDKCARNGIDLFLDVAEGLDTCLLDARKTKQILINLLSNAAKFTREGSIRLSAFRIDSKTLLSRLGKIPTLQHDGIFLALAVSDTGIGIPAHEVDRIFRPFEQIDSSLARQQVGTGLGLPLVKSLVELHGGETDVQSEPGKGSTFTVYLPWKSTSQEAAEPASPSKTHDLPTKATPLCLVVEDDLSAFEILRAHFQDLGIETISRTTAEGALSWLKMNSADLIVLDLQLPQMDGMKFLAAVKQNTQYSAIPVFVVSTVADKIKQQALALGVDYVLGKPVSKQEILSALTTLGWTVPASTQTKILVIGDDHGVIEITRQHLPGAQFRVFGATAANQGLRMAGELVPNLIILDQTMLSTSCGDLVKALRLGSVTAQLPVVVLTSDTLSADDRRILQTSNCAMLVKDSMGSDAWLGKLTDMVCQLTGQSATTGDTGSVP